MELIFIRIRINISILIRIHIRIRIRSSRGTLQLFLTAAFSFFRAKRDQKKRRAHFARPPLRSAREGEIDRKAVELD